MRQLTSDLRTTGVLLCSKAKRVVLRSLLLPFAETNFIYLHKLFIFYLLIFADFAKLCPFPLALPLFFPFVFHAIFQALLFSLSLFYSRLLFQVPILQNVSAHIPYTVPETAKGSSHSADITGFCKFCQSYLQ